MSKTIKKSKTKVAKKTVKKQENAIKKPKKRVLRKARALGLKREEVKIEKKAEIRKEIFQKPKVFPRKFVYAKGRRKEATARVRLMTGSGKITINGRDLEQYSSDFELRQTIESPLVLVGQRDKCDLQIKVESGGKRGQAEAIRLGISRCLKKRNLMFRVPLKKVGYLTRDAREKERKKYGLKGARRAPQWQKR